MTVAAKYQVDLERILAETTALTPDEVVTYARSRDVSLPHDAGTAVLITLDNGRDHTRPNTLGPRSLAELSRAIDAATTRAQAGEITAVAVTGKPFIFAAGVDLNQVENIVSQTEPKTISQLGHGVLNQFHNVGVPTFAFFNGLALGGGLEMGLHCDYRTVSSANPALALPEVSLGILPGWGGAWLLPNLIGAEAALKVIIVNPLNQNRMLKGRQAFELGIADAIFDGADFLERSLDWAAQVVNQTIKVARPEIDRSEWDAAVAEAKAFVDNKVSGAAPAPYRTLELVAAAKTNSRAEGFIAEDDSISQLLSSPETRASLYAFNLIQKRAKRPAGAPDASLAQPVTKVGVVGAGLMASQLALLFLRRLEVPVIISDLDQDRVDRGLASIHEELETLAGKKRIKPDQANRYRAALSGTTSLADFTECDLVIEAVFEELQVKKQVFAELEKSVSPTCVFATNTSSLSITDMAAELQNPERVVGFHFFNPVAVLPLLEIVRGSQTNPATLATAFAVAKELKKNAVLVKDAPAFVVNRVLGRMLCSLTQAIDEGTPVEVVDQALRPLGLPMTPMTLLQLIGPPVALHVMETLNRAFGDRFPVSTALRNIVAAKLPGVYDWDANAKPYVSEETKAILQQGNSPSTADQVHQRTVLAIAEEIGFMLDEQVVAATADIDLCLILGAGWPFHLGGITPYLDSIGASQKATGRRFADR